MRVKLITDDGQEIADWPIETISLTQVSDTARATINANIDGVLAVMGAINHILGNGGDATTSYHYHAVQPRSY